jgi:hypothetical protein
MSHRTETPSQDPAHLFALAADFDRLIGVTTPAPQAPKVARSAAAEPPLDSNGKSTCGDEVLERRGAARTLDRYRLQRHAAKILGWPAALSGCEFARQRGPTGIKDVQVWRNQMEHRGPWTQFKGLQTCGSVWSCPICSNRRAWWRRGDLQALMEYAEAEGLTLVMLTLTSQHDLQTSLVDQRRMMAKAKAGMTSRAAWKKGLLQHLVGSVTATEVTHGLHSGWHLHYHYILLLDLRHLPDNRDAVAMDLGDAAWPAWRSAATRAGLYVNRSAYSVEVGSAVARYPEQIEKVEGSWTLADEATRGAVKKGAGRHPFELLRLSCDDNDESARDLFVEYSAAMKGASALQWSRGLADLVGIDVDTSDEGDRQDKPAVMQELMGDLTSPEWHGDMMRPGVRARRGRMAVAVAMAGRDGFEAERDNGKKDPHVDELVQVLADLGLAEGDMVDLVEDDDRSSLPPVSPGRNDLANEIESGAAELEDCSDQFRVVRHDGVSNCYGDRFTEPFSSSHALGCRASIKPNETTSRRGPKAARPQGAQVPKGPENHIINRLFKGG